MLLVGSSLSDASSGRAGRTLKDTGGRGDSGGSRDVGEKGGGKGNRGDSGDALITTVLAVTGAMVTCVSSTPTHAAMILGGVAPSANTTWPDGGSLPFRSKMICTVSSTLAAVMLSVTRVGETPAVAAMEAT